MSRHRFPISDFIEQIADERGESPDEVVIDNVEISAKRGEIVIDAHGHDPTDPTQ